MTIEKCFGCHKSIVDQEDAVRVGISNGEHNVVLTSCKDCADAFERFEYMLAQLDAFKKSVRIVIERPLH